ncbi:MAG TPA: ATP-binding protein [Terriglobales bacterium]|nr:ATP-binding protein [Terriglobales bacterium]
MSFRRKLLLVFALTVFFTVAAVSLIVSALARRAFQKADEERAAALVSQFRNEFNRRGADVTKRIDAIATSDSVARMALSVSNGAPDYGAYLNEAKTIADAQQLDFLEFTDSEGSIISSAQSPARFGYKEPAIAGLSPATGLFLKKEELADGIAIGMFATKAVRIGDKPLYVIGGRRLDPSFVASLELPAGMRVLLYQNVESAFSAKALSASSGALLEPEKLAPLIERAQRTGQETSEILHWTIDSADDEKLLAIPLKGLANEPLGVLLVGSSRRTYVDLARRIRSAALLVGGAGIIVSILLSGWIASRVTRPVEQLAAAARQVTEGKWNAQVDSKSSDELGELASAFNRMTRELVEQKEQLVQTERVAAWRELARRLAHELKNPLFPLQITVENLLRARQQSPELFEEIFRESSATLLAEISNLKSIISRFSEFSKMPQPQFQPVQLNDSVRAVTRLFQAQFDNREKGTIECCIQLDDHLPTVPADPDLIHRAISNLVLNAMDAMPNGGDLTLRTSHDANAACVEVVDTGTGLTPEECARLFTPYYTSKQHGTGLGLAIVQSVINDHGGKITAESEPGRGTTFRIRLPLKHEAPPAPIQTSGMFKQIS